MWQDHMNYARILIVDDEADNLRVFESLLKHAGFRAVVSTQDPREAVEIFSGFDPDLVLLDLHMPGRDGFEVMADLAPLVPEHSFVPILVITADPDPELRRRALRLGAKDFLTKPFETTEVILRIKNLLETRFLHRELQRHNESLEDRIRDRTHELALAQVEILRRLAIAAEYRDDITGRHAERVGVLSALIARVLGMHRDEINLIRRAAPLHDVGKIGIPDAILMKPGPLTVGEFEVMKGHTEIGARILSGSQYPLLQIARIIASSHHERWDGSGYSGTGGESIPLVGRIVAVADVFDSLTHRRPYKDAYQLETAVGKISDEAGAHFDPKVVQAFKILVEQELVGELETMSRGLGPTSPFAAHEIGARPFGVVA